MHLLKMRLAPKTRALTHVGLQRPTSPVGSFLAFCGTFSLPALGYTVGPNIYCTLAGPIIHSLLRVSGLNCVATHSLNYVEIHSLLFAIHSLNYASDHSLNQWGMATLINVTLHRFIRTSQDEVNTATPVIGSPPVKW